MLLQRLVMIVQSAMTCKTQMSIVFMARQSTIGWNILWGIILSIFLMVHRHKSYRKSYITDFVQNSSHCNMVITIFVIRGYGDQKSIKEWICSLNISWKRRWRRNAISTNYYPVVGVFAHSRVWLELLNFWVAIINQRWTDKNWAYLSKVNFLYGFWLQLLFWSDFCLHSWRNLCLLIWVFSYQKCQETAWAEFWSEKQLLTELTKDIFCK